MSAFAPWTAEAETEVSEGAPIEKVNAPPTGCESSETARQATV